MGDLNIKQNAGIISVGTYIPKKIVTNNDIESLVDTSDEWIISRTGIKERRVSDDLSCSQMAVMASQKALDKAGISVEEIELIIVTSLSFDKLCPSTASLVQDGLKAINAAAFDISSACAGFSYGLATAFSFVESGAFNNVLLVGAENISKFINWKDRNTCILFGDGAGAVIVSKTEKPYGHICSYLACDGRKNNLIEIPAGGSAKPASVETVQNNEHFLRMKGQEVFKFAVKAIPDAINNVIYKGGVELKDIDLFIPHQANIRIIESATKKLGLPKEKFFTNLERYGNTSTASVPLALNEAHEKGIIKNGSLIVLIGFGGGLSWGANLVRWRTND